MSTVLITRPHPQGEELCALLGEKGISAVHHPLIEFLATKPIVNFEQILSQADIIIAVSQPAVQFCHQHLVQHSLIWPQTSRYLAIGQKTARLLGKLSQQQVNYPPHGDSEHLLSQPLLLDVKGRNIVILRGNGGREYLAEQLSLKGASVKYCEFYRRKFIPFDASDKVALWRKQNVSHVVFTSEEQLCFFIRQVSENDLPWITNLQIFVPSQRIAQVAKEIGFQNTIVVGSANNFDLVAAIQPKVIGILNDNQQHNARNA